MNSNKLFEKKVFDKHTPNEENEILKKALLQININVFVYDILSEKIYFVDDCALPFGISKKMGCNVDEILENKIIDLACFDPFRSIFTKMHEGERTADAIIEAKYQNNCVWNHIVMMNCFDKNGKAVRAIGTIQDISNRVESELRYSKEQQFRLAMLSDSQRVYEINVTRNRFMRLQSIQDSTDYGTWNLYTQEMNVLCRNCVFYEDWEVFMKIAKIENLIDGFENGTTEFYCEYRIVNDDKTLSWSSSTTHLLKDPVTEDVKGFIYVKDIDEQKKQEIWLRNRAEHDSLTGSYNRFAAEKLISQILLDSNNKKVHGFLYIDVDDFKLVNDTFGHVQGDFLLKQIVIGLGTTLRDEDIFARMGGDEFIVFLNDISSVAHAKYVANRFCKYVNNICIEQGNDFRCSISIGIAVYPCDGTTFDELYKVADVSLYQVKQNGKNHVSMI